jgi:hypothetical protein
MIDSKKDLPSLDQTVFTVIDQAPYALPVGAISQKLGQPEPIVLAALERLVAAGSVKMTADVHTRVYYTQVQHLR